jgi:MarR family transcriptional regulator, organic hydroperoxide resistance regulator
MTQSTPTGCADGAPHSLDAMLCFSVYAASHAFNRVYKPILDRIGLTYPQYLAMMALWQSDDQTVGALGRRLALESSTLTPLLKRLEAMGHVQRRRDAQDERQVRVGLTAQGRALRAQAEDAPDCILRATGLTHEQARALNGEIVRLRDTLMRAAATSDPAPDAGPEAPSRDDAARVGRAR